jgi:hypothetical protein
MDNGRHKVLENRSKECDPLHNEHKKCRFMFIIESKETRFVDEENDLFICDCNCHIQTIRLFENHITNKEKK